MNVGTCTFFHRSEGSSEDPGVGRGLDTGFTLRGVGLRSHCSYPKPEPGEPLEIRMIEGFPQAGGYAEGVEILLVAEVDGELVLVEQGVDGALFDRATGDVLDPTGLELRGLEVEPAAA